ncbi:MFS transporter [Actinoplanes sp. G11-F43]|uniref:MFS transporter n=1 Tax=Actinoplanes sp. G11-F43 TaxID=3424130 RepID=UPI003D33E0EE
MNPSPPARDAVLRHRDFRLFLASQAVNEVGRSMFPVALVGVVLLHHGPAELGLLLAIRGITASIVGLGAGVLVNRGRKSRALLANDIAQCAVVLVFATEPGSFAVLLALSAVSGFFSSVGEPAAGSLVPVLLAEDQLQRGNALKSIANRGAAIAGPALAGVLLTVADTRAVFLANAATFVVSATLLLAIREKRGRTTGERLRFLEDLGTGLAEVRRRPWVVAIIAIATAQAPLMVAPGFALLPVVVAETYPAMVYGLALSFMAAGEVAGGVLGSRWQPRRPGLVSLAGVLPYPLVLLALAAALPSPVILAGYLAAGTGFMLFGIYWYTALQRAIPADRLGVVLSIDQVGSFGLEPIGYAVSGVLAETIGPRRVLFGAGIIGLVMTLLPLGVRGVPRLADDTGIPAGSPSR